MLIPERLYGYASYQRLNDEFLYYDSTSDTRKYKEITIEPGQAYKYQGDFFGLLDELLVPYKLFSIALHLNGYTSPYDYDGIRTTIKIPQELNRPTLG